MWQMGDYLNVPDHMSPLKAESFLWLVAEEEVREVSNMRKMDAPLLAFKMEGTRWQGRQVASGS